MPMLACTHFVSWVVPVEGGKHQCQYCREIVAKKEITPKFEDLGAEYQAKWDAHEKGEAPAAAPPPGAQAAAPAKPA